VIELPLSLFRRIQVIQPILQQIVHFFNQLNYSIHKISQPHQLTHQKLIHTQKARHMSQHHKVFLGDYRKCTTQVAARSCRTLLWHHL